MMPNMEKGKYDDIINLPHHVSKTHPQMSMEARAAQFAPFAALTGYEDEIDETVRVTDEKVELNEEQKDKLNRKLQEIKKLVAKPILSITYFVPDLRKEGGKYVTSTGIFKKIDEYKKIIVLEDGVEIPICNIVELLYDTKK